MMAFLTGIHQIPAILDKRHYHIQAPRRLRHRPPERCERCVFGDIELPQSNANVRRRFKIHPNFMDSVC